MKSNVLYIGNKISKPMSGADQVNKRNQELLENISIVKYLHFCGGRLSKLFFNNTDEYLDNIDKEMKNHYYDIIFISQSLCGRACRHIKKRHPSVKIVIFFHNIEIQYAKEYLKTKGLKALPFYAAVRYWEKISCRYADHFITLNERDTKLLHEIYGQTTDLELPTTFNDLFNASKAMECPKQTKNLMSIDYLFVGVSFFANIEAVQWFIDEVMPKVSGHFYVVGKGMDKVSFNNLTERVHICGYVDDLSDYYYRAHMVVSPIHVGGGMKTKTVEALMYGKTILGTKEAFEGYKIDNRCMELCETANDYVTAINKISKEQSLLNPYARKLFNANYDLRTSISKFKFFFESIIRQ